MSFIEDAYYCSPPWDIIIDSRLFHTFDNAMRSEYIENLRIVLNSGGSYYMLVFSDKETLGYGPRRVSKQEIMTSFQDN